MTSEGSYRFGRFEVDLARGELLQSARFSSSRVAMKRRGKSWNTSARSNRNSWPFTPGSGAGTLNPNGISLPWTFIGSYTLGADGRGQVTYDQTVAGSAAGQLHIDFVVMDGGKEIRGMPTDSGYIVTCELARQ